MAFCASVAIMSVYPNKILTRLPGMLTHPFALADLASGSTSPNSSLQLPLVSDRRLSQSVANSYLLTALGPSFSSSSSSLVGNLARKLFVLISRQNKQRNTLTGAHPHPQNENPLLCHTATFFFAIFSEIINLIILFFILLVFFYPIRQSVPIYIYIYIYIYLLLQHVKSRAIPCPHQPQTRGDNAVSVAQGGTATPGATKQLLPPYRVLRYIYEQKIRLVK